MGGINLGLSETSGALLGNDSPWTRWHNKLYSTVLSVLQSVFRNSGFHNTMNPGYSAFADPSQSLCTSHPLSWSPWLRPGPRVQVKRSRTPLSLPPTVSSACLLSVESFSQRISLIREVRNADTKENSQRTLNNSDVVIKHSQGHLVPSQGL